MNPTPSPRPGRRAVRFAIAAMAASAACLAPLALAGPAVAGPGAPSWELEVNNRNPYGLQGAVDPFTRSATSFERQSGFNTYLINVENAGTGEVAQDPTTPVTVTDELPEGLWFAQGSQDEFEQAGEPPHPKTEQNDWDCSLSDDVVGEGPRVATCALSPAAPALPAKSKYQPLLLRVWVGATAHATVANIVTVKGGGASPSELKRDDPTETEEAVPFGIDEFQFEAVERSGGRLLPKNEYVHEEPTSHTVAECSVPTEKLSKCPDTEHRPPTLASQAGGHPYGVYTPLTFNYTTTHEGKLGPPGRGQHEFAAGPEQIEVELPPGLVGNALSAEQCSLEALEETREGGSCKPVGYLAFNLTYGELQSGRPVFGSAAGTPLYVVAPPPGYPAAFAAITTQADIVVVILPKVVRTSTANGQYTLETGVETSAPLRAARITFCGYGAVKPASSSSTELVQCATAPEQTTSEPFLTDPTHCETPLLASMRSTEYPSGEPASEPTGPAVMETYLDGSSPPPALLDEQFLQFAGPAGHEEAVDEPGVSRVVHPTQAEIARAGVTGCEAAKLKFTPKLTLLPASSSHTAHANTPTAMDLKLTLPREESEIPAVLQHRFGVTELTGERVAEPDVRDVRVQFPEGMGLSPSSAQGLTSCSDAQFDVTSTTEANCPAASQIGTAEVTSPLLASPSTGLPRNPQEPGQLQGELYVGEPECASASHPQACDDSAAEQGKLFRTFLQLKDPRAGVDLKVAGVVTVNPQTGEVRTIFEHQPQLPFESLVVHLKGGPRAPFATSHECSGSYRANSEVTAWAAAPTEVEAGESFITAGTVEQEGLSDYVGPHFAPSADATASTEAEFPLECAESVAPFAPAFNAGTNYPAAGRSSAFSLTVSPGVHAEEEQGLKGLEVHMPPGLTGKLAGIPQCPEAQAIAGTCGAESQVGTATVLVGSGSHPLAQQGKVYLTGPDKADGDPFGLVTVVDASAGPYDLGTVVVRAGIAINPSTAAVTVSAEPFPQILDGVPLRIRTLNVDVDGHGHEFLRNPTSCTASQISATLTSAESVQVGAASKFAIGGCGALAFSPSFSASTLAKTSRPEGAALTVKITQPAGQADLKRVDIQLPGALPSRQSTLIQACTLKVFEEAPLGSACPQGSRVGTATARTPLLSSPLSGPAILVSHGGEAFPDLEFLLEGEGVHIDVIGRTQIKNGITSSLFETIPDQPIESFETVLPEGPHSILAANGNLCAQSLAMPTTIEAQNGALIKRTTTISITGCKKSPKAKTNAQKLKKALKACRKQDKHHRKRRLTCERKARKHYAKKTAKKTGKKTGKKASFAGAGRTQTQLSLQRSLLSATTGAQDALSAVAGAAVTDVVATARALDEAAPGDCKNEALRAESDYNSATGEPYSLGLPECRAYELVTPAEKQGYGVNTINEPTVVAPSGHAVGWTSLGAFAEPLDFLVAGSSPSNKYVSRRTAAPDGEPEWKTSSAVLPAGISAAPSTLGALSSDFSPELESEAACGFSGSGGYLCAQPGADGLWQTTPNFQRVDGNVVEDQESGFDQAQSTDLSRIFLLPGVRLLPQDTLRTGGIYEVTGIGTPSAQLRLVNVRTSESGQEEELGVPEKLVTSGEYDTPFLGDAATTVADHNGTAYHAVSNNGETVFFTAQPGSQETLFARVSCEQGPSCTFLEHEGQRVAGTGRTTIDLSCESETEQTEGRCESEKAVAPAVFQGASEDGSKVFFSGNDALWEYNFDQKPRLTQVADPVGGSSEGELGVVRNSPDGSHLYYVRNNELRVRNTVTNESTDIATLPARESGLWGYGGVSGCEGAKRGLIACDSESRHAQVSDDGRYLVFSTYAQLPTGPEHKLEDENGCAGERDEEDGVKICGAEAVYLWDAEGGHNHEGELIWVSRPAPGTPNRNGGQSSTIPALPGNDGAVADFDDIDRAVNQAGEVLFESKEKLGVHDASPGQSQVYLWHCIKSCGQETQENGVSLISDGHGSSVPGGISESGDDIFFYTATQLLPQDTDELQDLYDARVEGGTRAPVPAASCVGEECQEPLSPEPVFGSAGSSLFAGP